MSCKLSVIKCILQNDNEAQGPVSMNLLVLGAHNPEIDPRERWIVETAQESGFHVTFLATGDSKEEWNGANVVSLPVERMNFASIISNMYKLVQLYRTLGCFFILLNLPLAMVALIFILSRDTVFVLRKVLRFLKHPFSLEENQSEISMNFWTYNRVNIGFFKDFLLHLSDSRYIGMLMRLTYNFQFHIIPVNLQFIEYARKKTNVEIIHANDFETLMSALVVGNNQKSRIVFDSQEFFPFSDPRHNALEKFLYLKIEKKWTDKVHVFCTVSTSLGQVIKDYYKKKKIFIVPNAVPKQNLYLPVPSRRERSKMKFVFQGNFAPNRGIEFLVDIWVHIDSSKFELHLVGTDNRFKNEIMNRAASLDLLEKGVFFPDSVHPNRLVQNLLNYDVGIIPYMPIDHNYRNCCPNKLSQYMSVGLPIISNQLVYVGMELKQAECGLSYYNGDQQSLINSVHHISKMEIYERFSANALTYHEKYFNWEIFGQRFIWLYRGDPQLSNSTSVEVETANPLEFQI